MAIGTGTSLVVRVGGAEIAAAQVVNLGTQPVAAGNLAQPIQFANGGAVPITIASVSGVPWGFNISVTGLTFPLTINPGQQATGVLGTTNWPLLPGPLAGVYFNHLTIAYTEGVAKTAVFDPVGILAEAASTGVDEETPGFADFYRRYVFDIYYLSNALRTPQNELQLNAGLNDPTQGGHLGLAQRTMPAFAAAGGKVVWWWQPWGAHHNLLPETGGDIQFDALIHAQEYGGVYGRPDIWNTFEQALDYAATLGIEVCIYTGSLRMDPHFLNLMYGPGRSPEAMLSRFWHSSEWMYRRAHVEKALDVATNIVDLPGNELMNDGEPRYELLKMMQELKDLQGMKISLEPRPQDEPQWRADRRWHYTMVLRAWYRNNPDWFFTGDNAITDAHMYPGRITILLTDSTVGLTPWQVASAVFMSQSIALPLSSGYMQRGTLQQLYDESIAIVNAAKGR